MRRHLIGLLLVGLFVALATATLAFPRIDIGGFQRGSGGPLGLRLGLDIQGGSHLVYQTKEESPSRDEMRGLLDNIRRRVDVYGVAEPVIQQLGDRRILLQLPGIQDIEEAKRLVGATAELDFREVVENVPVPVPELDAQGNPRLDEKGNILFKKDAQGNLVMEPGPPVIQVAKGTLRGVEKGLTGAYLIPNAASVDRNPTTSSFQVTLGFNSDGQELLEQITTRNVNKILGIFIDGVPVSTPIVRGAILAGQRGVIEGLDLNEAQILAIQLNSGALPLAIDLVQETDVDPTLGNAALDLGVGAGLVGLGLVLLFMILYYRVPGVTAALALAFYTLLSLAIIKLIPVTVSLSGLAGLVLSIGMAVDANVLIFERMKEELKSGRTLGAAMDVGFERAWPAIRDGNVTTLLTCIILFWFADRLGASFVMGFAVTLFLGVVISMLTALLVMRVFLQTVAATALGRRVGWFHP